MITREIPRKEWSTFCQDFSRKHYGWPVTVESLRYDSGYRVLSRDKELDEVAVSSGKERTEAAQIELGTERSAHQMMLIPGLQTMRIERTESGVDIGLELHSREFGLTIIRFNNPAYSTETIDSLTIMKINGRQAGLRQLEVTRRNPLDHKQAALG